MREGPTACNRLTQFYRSRGHVKALTARVVQAYLLFSARATTVETPGTALGKAISFRDVIRASLEDAEVPPLRGGGKPRHHHQEDERQAGDRRHQRNAVGPLQHAPQLLQLLRLPRRGVRGARQRGLPAWEVIFYPTNMSNSRAGSARREVSG